MSNLSPKELEAYLREARNALELWQGLYNSSKVSSGICLCGETLANHEHSIYAGHSPNDSGEYYAKIAGEVTKDLLLRLTPLLGTRS